MVTTGLTRLEMLQKLAAQLSTPKYMIERTAMSYADEGDGDYTAALARLYEASEIMLSQEYDEETLALSAGDYDAPLELSVPMAERRRLAARGHALSDGSYPIPDIAHLHKAAHLAASGHGDVAAAKKLIKRRAKDLGVSLDDLEGFGDGEDDDNDEAKATAAANETILWLTQAHPGHCQIDVHKLQASMAALDVPPPRPPRPASSLSDDDPYVLEEAASLSFGLTEQGRSEFNAEISRLAADGAEIALSGSRRGTVGLAAPVPAPDDDADAESDRILNEHAHITGGTSGTGLRHYTSNSGSVDVLEADVTEPLYDDQAAEVERIYKEHAGLFGGKAVESTGNTVVAPGPQSEWGQFQKGPWHSQYGA